MAQSTDHLAGQKIRQWREAREQTAEEFGDRLGQVPAQTVYGWETRGKIAKVSLMNRLAELGVCELGDWVKPAVPSVGAEAA